MAWGRKKSGGRKEPLFGLPAALADLRLSPEDRIPAAADDDKPKKSVPKHKPEEDDDEPPPRERKPRAAKSGAKRRAKSRGRFRFGRLVYWGAVLGLWAGIAIIGVVVWVGAHLPAIQSLEIPKRPPTIQIVGLDGSLLASRGEMAGTNVALKDLPPYLPEAVIAIEDRRFYYHFGIDPIGLARAVVANLRAGGVVEGGSTLTQQLAKNLFLTPERTFERKIQEVILSVWLEASASQERRSSSSTSTASISAPAPMASMPPRTAISASRRGTSPLPRPRRIAGLAQGAGALSPLLDPDAAEARAQVVLAAMREVGYHRRPRGEPRHVAADPPGPRRRRRQRPLRRRLDRRGARDLSAIDQDIVVETTIDPSCRARRRPPPRSTRWRQVRRQPGRVCGDGRRAAPSRRWSAGATMPTARSTAPSTATASPARPSSRSST